MSRYIKDYDPLDLTVDFIKSLDWDVIELKCRLDPLKLTEYVNILKRELHHLYFDFTYEKYLRPEVYEKYMKENQVFNYIGKIGGWTISWPVDRDIPIPGQYQAKPEMYPELNSADFYYDSKIQSQYNFGYLKQIHEILTEKALRQMLMSSHPPGLYVLKHTDGDSKKLHIPFETNDKATFSFGEDLERVYQMELGKMYLINPSVPHGTNNEGENDRIHLLTRVDFDYMHTLFAMNSLLE